MDNFLTNALVAHKNNTDLASELYPNASVMFKMAVNHFAAIKVSQHEAEEIKKTEKKNKK